MATKKEKTAQKKESISGKIVKSPKVKPGKTITGDMPQHETIKKNNDYLASFPEMNTNPIIEIDWEGNLQYQNPACQNAFPDIVTLGLKHPLFADWVKILKSLKAAKPEQPVIREVPVGNSVYEQTYFLINKNQIRIYGRDITKRHYAEQVLQNAQATLRVSHDNSPLGIELQ